MLVTVFIIDVNKAKCNKSLKCSYTIRWKYCSYNMTTVMTNTAFIGFYTRMSGSNRIQLKAEIKSQMSLYFDYHNPALRLFHPNYAWGQTVSLSMMLLHLEGYYFSRKLHISKEAPVLLLGPKCLLEHSCIVQWS